MLLQEVIKQRVVVIYGGRFQPMGGHHHKAYQRLVDKFGSSNVFVATSNATSDKSPFNFAEKKKIISAYGVPSKQIVRVKNVYQANEITKKLSSNTVVLWAVGAKDGDRLVAGKYFKKYKPNQSKYDSFKEHGYIFCPMLLSK